MEKSGTLSRRSFLKSTALAAGGMAAAGSVGFSSVAAAAETEAQTVADEHIYTNFCRGNCGGYCTLNGLVRDGKLVSVMPRTYDRAENEGWTNGCVKGISSPLRVYGQHRLLHPMRQMGERGSDNWEEISWDEAFKLIAEKFQAAFEKDGPQSVGLWSGAGNPASALNGAPFHIANWIPGPDGNALGASRFLQKSGITHFGEGGDQAGMYMRFFMLSVPIQAAEDLQNSGAIVAWGSNPAAATIGKRDWYWICKARENGAKLITIDPLFTETAGKSDLWVPVRMGTDAALMCALANHIIEQGKADEEYLKNKSVAPLLVKEDGTYLRASEVGLPLTKTDDGETDDPVVWDAAAKDFVVHMAAKDPALTGTRDAKGVKVRTVYDVTMKNIAPFTVDYAAEECGIERDTILQIADTLVNNRPSCLAIDWGIEHTYNCFRLYYAASFLASVLGDVGKPGGGYCTPNGMGSTPQIAPITTNTANCFLKDAKESPVITGDWIVDIMESGEWNGQPFPINALYITCHNPMDNGCDPNAMLKAWEGIDFVVTADSHMTTTAHYSDLVLPVSLSWETEDYSGNMKGILQKAIEPLGEAKSDMDIYRGIAAALGWDDLYTKTDEEYLHDFLDTPENLKAGLGYDVYHEKGVVEGDYVYNEYPAFEYNPLGRTVFYLEQFMPRDVIMQAFPREDCMPGYIPTVEAYKDNPERETYPLFGFSSHDNYHGQSMYGHNVWMDAFRMFDGSPFCRIHENAAAERGIKTGDLVRAYSKYGECVLKAVVTKGIREDCVWFPHGFYWDEFVSGSAQQLTGHHPDPQTCNANFNDFILQVEKYEGGAK